MKKFLEKHFIWFLLAIMVLEGLNLFSPLGKNPIISIFFNLAILLCSVLLIIGVRSNKKK